MFFLIFFISVYGVIGNTDRSADTHKIHTHSHTLTHTQTHTTYTLHHLV
jgi:hypothetical protein